MDGILPSSFEDTVSKFWEKIQFKHFLLGKDVGAVVIGIIIKNMFQIEQMVHL